MKKYEYKMVESKVKIGIDFSKKYLIRKSDGTNWGMEGWKFCTWGNGVVIFIREVDE